MNNRLVKYISILSIVFLILFCFSTLNYVKADSGWDSSYDSGSFDSGSSWDSGSSYGGSSGEFGIVPAILMEAFVTIHYTVFVLSPISDMISKKTKKDKKKVFWTIFISRVILLILLDIISPCFALLDFFMLFILIFVATPLLNNNTKVNNNSTYKEISNEEANKVIPNFDIKDFNFRAYQIFYDTQIAWMNFDYDKLKEILTDELYNTYLMDLEALKVKNQRNTMKNFELIKTKLIDLKEENNNYIAKVLLEVKFYDYIEDVNTNKILRGNSNHKLDNTYILTFIKSKEGLKESKCPNCGAPITSNQIGVCEYCKSKIVNTNHDWVMSKKEKISQR